MINSLPGLLPASMTLTGQQLDQLQDHWELLLQWNRRVNLTSILDPADAAALHYRDSLQPLVHGIEGPIVDMGTGGGFPGIPLAIALPEQSFVLIEPRNKRVSFLKTVVSRLKLDNVRVVLGHSTDTPSERFASLVTRATFSEAKDLTTLSRWVLPGGNLYLYRSPGHLIVPSGERHPYSAGPHERALDILPNSCPE